jgi:hypothetical protein
VKVAQLSNLLFFLPIPAYIKETGNSHFKRSLKHNEKAGIDPALSIDGVDLALPINGKAML